MSVQHVNHHKPTRLDHFGTREAACPVCGRWVAVTSYRDDTRWRYGMHRGDQGEVAQCGGSYELVPAEKPGKTGGDG